MASNDELLLTHASILLETDNINSMITNGCKLPKRSGKIQYTICNGERALDARKQDFYHISALKNDIDTKKSLYNFINHWCDVYQYDSTIDYITVYSGEYTIDMIGIVSLAFNAEIVALEASPDHGDMQSYFYMDAYSWKPWTIITS